MRITVEFSEKEVGEICRFTGIPKKGPAIRKLVEEALQLARRKEISDRFLSGEWGAELDGFEAAKQADRDQARSRSRSWRS